MNTKGFVITCAICGSENATLSNYRKNDEEGMRLTCKQCGNKEDL